jgi:uncharacterized protein (TIGR02646 family)
VKYIFIASPVNPPNELVVILTEKAAALARKRKAKTRSEFLRKTSNHSWGRLKAWLMSLSHNKCWYCEASSLRAVFDVDHFRPKLGTTSLKVRVAGHDGYYWLAYNWKNFRLSCQFCNRKNTDTDEVVYGKGNEFSLRNEIDRCFDKNGDLTAERPKLLDPSCEDDVNLLAHPLNGEVQPCANLGGWDYDRAEYTKNILGFNNFGIPRYKRDLWQLLSALILAEADNPTDQTKAIVSRHLSLNQEYSRFFRASIGTHRDKDWIEAIL